MMLFSECNPHIRVTVLLCLLLLCILQLFMQSLCYNYKEKKLLFFNFLPILLTQATTVLLMLLQNGDERLGIRIPLLCAVIMLLLLCSHTVLVIIRLRRRHRNMLTENSVKDAYDHLPFGLCFFAKNGLPMLCNGQMSAVARELIGKSMQSLGELEEALAHPAESVSVLTTEGRRIYRLADGREWYFEKTEVTDGAGNRFIQVISSDYTELDLLNSELKARNIELKKMMKRLEQIRLNIADSIREQEILTAKMRLHNKMGSCMLSARRYFMQDCPKENKAELLERWSKTVGELRDEIGQADERAPGEELMRIAADLGVEIMVSGSFPDDPDIAYLFVTALRECLTNAIHHASASLLRLTLEYGESTVTGAYVNNGEPPACEITEGGGLKSLRSRIEEAGGSMEVQSLPVFELRITLPKTTEDREESDDEICACS